MLSVSSGVGLIFMDPFNLFFNSMIRFFFAVEEQLILGFGASGILF
jgi:hypothetical protein